MSSHIEEYFSALERIKKGIPERVPQGTAITNDSVSIEAGRGKGAIKKSRPEFSELVDAIGIAAQEQKGGRKDSQKNIKQELSVCKADLKRYKNLYLECISREISLAREIFDLRKELNRKYGSKVSPFRIKSLEK